MNRIMILVAMASLAGCAGEKVALSPPASAAAPEPVARVSFDRQIRPILETRCSPCHFEGGKMYDKLPFDRAETIRMLGTKLFTRIKDAQEQAVIRAFLEQQADGQTPSALAARP